MAKRVKTTTTLPRAEAFWLIEDVCSPRLMKALVSVIAETPEGPEREWVSSVSELFRVDTSNKETEIASVPDLLKRKVKKEEILALREAANNLSIVDEIPGDFLYTVLLYACDPNEVEESTGDDSDYKEQLIHTTGVRVQWLARLCLRLLAHPLEAYAVKALACVRSTLACRTTKYQGGQGLRSVGRPVVFVDEFAGDQDEEDTRESIVFYIDVDHANPTMLKRCML